VPNTPTPLDIASRVVSEVCQLGFRRADATAATGRVLGSAPSVQFEQLLRQSLPLLTVDAARDRAAVPASRRR
jgi:hypothetical protein